MQSTGRSLIAYAEWVLTRRLNLAGRSWHGLWSFLDWWLAGSRGASQTAKTAYERWKQKSYRHALVPFGELVMFMPIEKPKDKGEVRNRVGFMLSLVDRSDEVDVGMPERGSGAR